ncbi:unnamed protein product [Schistosoma margrebowiei]|uniref:Melanoma inhibitory activity protein 3 n=1 Tax=Schistosoma margrebowiei TaxID=48269 RepID=A0AA85A5E4_9TREM|nr:unnamed protein product [Schistosoma margrebowiei]
MVTGVVNPPSYFFLGFLYRMKIYLVFLLIGFGALLCHSEAMFKQHLPAELLCSDINCLKTITTGSLIKDVNVPNKKTLKVNTLVDIIGLSADATNSMMKIKFGEEHLYIDPSFVQIKDSVNSRKFLKVKNFDINLNPSTLLDERTLNLMSPYQLPSDEDLNYKSTKKISEKVHPDNKQTLFRNQRQSNAYDTKEGTNEIDEMDVVSRRSYDQVSKQETTYKIDSDEVEQDEKIEEDNDDNEFDYNNSSEIKHGDTDTADYPSESPGEPASVNQQPSSVQSHHAEMKVSETEHVESHVQIRPPTVSSDTDKESKVDVSSRSEQGEPVSVNQQPSSVQSHHAEMKVSETEHVESHVPIRPPTVSSDTDKESKVDVSSRSEQGEPVSVNQQPSSVQSHHAEMKVSETEHVESHVQIRPPTVSSDTDKESKVDVSSRSEQGEPVSVNQQPSSVQSHHAEMKVSETEHVESHVPIRPPTVSSDTDKESKVDVSSRSEQGEPVSVNQQPSSVQSHHAEMKVSETEHVESHVPIRPPTVSSDTDKESKVDVSSRSEQGEPVSVNQQPSSVQSHHAEMKVSETEHVESHVPIRPPTVSSDTDKESKVDVSSRSEQGEPVSVNQQPSSVQSHHAEMKVSETEHVESHVQIRPPTVSSDTDKESKVDVSSRSEQGEPVSVNQQPSSVQSHHAEMKVSETEHVESHVPIRPPTVSSDTDKESKVDVSSRSEQGEPVSVNQQPSSVQSHHAEMKVSETEHVESHVPIRPPTVSSDTDKESKVDVSSRSEQGEPVSVNQQPSSVQSHHAEMKVSETEHVESHVPIRPPTVSSDTDKESNVDVSQIFYSTSSSNFLNNDSHIESNMSNSHFSLHDRKQGVITSDLIGVQDIGIIYSSDVNSSTLSSVSRKMSEDQIIFDHHSVPVHLGLIQCIYWAANASFDKTYSKTVRSPFSLFLVNGFRYFFAAANVSLQYLPENIISNLDNFLLETFSLSVNFIIAWMIFIFHLIFMWNLSKGVHFLLYKYIFVEKYTSPSLVEYLKLEEYSIQLASQLSDTEEFNSHLSKWANSLSYSLQNLQEEYTSKLSEMTLSMDESRESFIRAQSELNHLKNTHNSLEQNLRLKLTDKEEVIHELNSEINRLKQLHSENDDKWKKSLLDLEESNRKSIDELKEEQEQLYSQANLYYNRMKTMQSEVDKILESRKASEEKLLIKEAEFQSLLATFNTLKGLEVIFEQESSSKQETNDMEEREVTTTDNLSNVSRTLEDDVEISDKSSIISESALCDLNEVDEKTTEKSRLQKNLSLLLDVGRLHAQIRLKDEQIKAEESKAKNEHDLRVEVESKMEEVERENSTLKANLIHIEQERNAYQTKLDILSCYFKERELELQRDLGKHVVVGSESSEALMHSRKRNQELEGEVKVLRDQMAALRRELVETERTSRRQISELDKRSHENWLAARASDHQIQDLREENFSLRQKLIESENNALRSTMRTIPEKINSSSRDKIMNIFTRPILPLEFMKNPSLRDVRSQSRNSLTNLTSQRPVAEANPFPFIPTPPRGTMPFSGGLQRDVIPTPTRPLLPGFPPVQMSFPSAFLAQPFAPVMKAMTDQNNKQNSSPSSVSGSLK